MITVLKIGHYELGETKEKQVLLILNKTQAYMWIKINAFAGILTFLDKPLTTEIAREAGKFRLYNVREETNFTNAQHLELMMGTGRWQGYVLPVGLPTADAQRKSILTTQEQLTCPINTCLFSSGYDISASNTSML